MSSTATALNKRILAEISFAFPKNKLTPIAAMKKAGFEFGGSYGDEDNLPDEREETSNSGRLIILQYNSGYLRDIQAVRNQLASDGFTPANITEFLDACLSKQLKKILKQLPIAIAGTVVDLAKNHHPSMERGKMSNMAIPCITRDRRSDAPIEVCLKLANNSFGSDWYYAVFKN